MASESGYLGWGGDSWSVSVPAPEMRGFTRAEVGGSSSGSYSWGSDSSGRVYGAYLPPSATHGGVLAPEYRGFSREAAVNGEMVSFSRTDSHGREIISSTYVPNRCIGTDLDLKLTEAEIKERGIVVKTDALHWGVTSAINTVIDWVTGHSSHPVPYYWYYEKPNASNSNVIAAYESRKAEMLSKGEVLGDMPIEERTKMTLCSREPERDRELDNDVTHRGDRYDSIKQGTIIYRHDIDRMIYMDKDGKPQSMGHPSDRQWMDQFAQVYTESKQGKESVPEPVKSNWVDRWAEGRQATVEDYKKVGEAVVEVGLMVHGGEVGLFAAGKAGYDIAQNGTIDSAKKVGHDIGMAMAEVRSDAARDGYAHLSDIGI